MENSLPIWQIRAQIIGALQGSNRLVLVAPTGSGKTTQTPQMLLDDGIVGPGQQIVVLQPRRVAARTVAARVAWERRSRLGAEVGYQIRFDDRTSVGTRICFVTEGILLRWLQDDPELGGIGAVLFDEFHERNLLSDVALALVKQLQETRRPDLKMLVMSATLEAEPVARYLDDCPILVSEGRTFPVEIRFLDTPDERPVTEQAADAVEHIVNSTTEGDILVFMPGMGEINSAIGACRAARLRESVAFIPLHGELQPQEQDVAFAPNALRKVVVATNVAETSVTIDGIRYVVDGGLARVARYDAERGIGTLFLEPISRASAEQRAGRAGRTAPGICQRLWTEGAHLNRPVKNTPEIQRCDLAEVVLLLHSFGIRNAAGFDWLDKPDPAAVERAEKLLRTLGALAAEGGGASAKSDLTAVGWKMLRLPMHPRYSRMIVEAQQRGCAPAAALCAALVSGRDLLMRLGRDDKHIASARELFEASADSDFYTLMRAYQFARNSDFNVERCRRYGVHAQVARQVQQTYEQISSAAAQDSAAPAAEAASADDPLRRCIMAGFIDQLCQRRDQGTLDCDLTEGRAGTLMRESVVQSAPLFVAASLREVAGRTGAMTLLGLATAVQKEWIREMFPEQVNARVEHLFDRTHKRVAAVRLERFHDLVIHHEHQREVDPAAAGRCLAEAYGKTYFELPLFNHELKQAVARLNLIAAVLPELEFPKGDEGFIMDFLASAFAGMTLVKEAQAAPLREAFFERLGRERSEWLHELAPLAVAWPKDKKLKLLYPENSLDDDGQPNAAELQVKLHEIFAEKEHPHICEGRLPVKIWLCAPDGKRLEATFNWPAFRANSYPKLRPALQKKFPGFVWV